MNTNWIICSIKYLFKEILYPCPFLIATSFGSYDCVLVSGLLLICKLLKQWSFAAKLTSSLYLCHTWPQQGSVCRSGALKFARLVPYCDVRYDFHVKSMFDSGHVLLMSFVFIFAYWCPTRFRVVEDLLTLLEHICFLVGFMLLYH